MNTAQYFEELRSITTRLDRLLPPTHAEQGRIAERKGLKYAVIEAKPREIIQVQHPNSQWRFAGDIPALHQTQASRRAVVECVSRHQTSLHATDLGAHCALPPGITLWHASDTARRILLLARRDLEMLFESDAAQTLPYDADAGMFVLPGEKELCFRDSMLLIERSYPYLYKICWEYADIAAHMYGLTFSEFGVISRVTIQRLHPQKGSPLRLLQTRQARFDGGPVLMISVGLPSTAHDVAPTLAQNDNAREHPVRIFVPEGVMVVMDGDARFRYSHGFPVGQEICKDYYLISIFMDCMGQTSIVGYERETRTLIMATPMRMENIITTVVEPQSRSNVHTCLQRDTLWRIVQAMRTRVRAAESHLITKKYTSRQGLQPGSSAEISKRQGAVQ